MVELNVNKLRELTVSSHTYADFDSSHTFYYDETNNFRKFYVRESDLNYQFNSNFVLGGIQCSEEEVDLKVLFNDLNLQKNITDVKLKHIASGSFIDCLKSKKLHTYLLFLNKKKIHIHFSSINLLFYALADIVDSAIMNSDAAIKLGLPFAMQLKNDLYKLAKTEFQSLIELFYIYEYPNIKKESITEFINDFIALFDDYIHTREFHFGLSSLKQILVESKKNSSLPFITDQVDYILLKDFSDFYLRPLYLFKNSKHHFDNEDFIKKILSSYKFKDDKKTLDIYKFINSEESLNIQASDIIVGLMGKLTYFINSSDSEKIASTISSLEEFQVENLKLLFSLIHKSSDFNPAFIHCIDSVAELQKYDIMQSYL